MSAERRCEDCRHFLARDATHKAFHRTYAVDVCLDGRVANRHGVMAITIATSHDGRCGPNRMLWRAK